MARTDSASRVILAPAHRIYRALLDPEAVAAWRPPEGMRAELHAFDAREGGIFRVSFVYTDVDHAAPGKSSKPADTIHGRFLELVPDTRVVELIEFESGDPAMTVTTTLAPLEDGTEVTIRCDGVPAGIRPDEHAAGIASTLAKLAAFIE
jgi:uncharacterized protein YndB with AHSA1/START domain